MVKQEVEEPPFGLEQARASQKEVEFTRLLETLERKATEIIDLKSKLHNTETELSALKLSQSGSM